MKKLNVSLAQTLAGGILLASSGMASAAVTAFTQYNIAANGVGGTSSALVSIVAASTWANTNGTPDNAASSKYLAQSFGTSTQGSLRVFTNNGLDPASAGYGSGDDETTAAPNHAIDNEGAQEFILFQFNTAVSLNSLKLEYPNAGSGLDSDVTVLAYKGAGAPVMTNVNSTTTAGNLGDTNSWTQFSFDASPSDVNGGISNFNAGGVASQYWLIGAYNKHLAGVTGGLTNDYSYDYLKLAGIGGNCGTSGTSASTNCGYTPPGSGVPEPSSLALAGLGLMGGIRRWKRKAA